MGTRSIPTIAAEPIALDRRIPESLIHDIWRRGDFRRDLRTTDGAQIVIQDPGRHNSDQGPDFTSARIRIGELEWAGDIEIHYSSSDWIKHRHDSDERYNRVVLHVVLKADIWTGSLTRASGTTIPEVVIGPLLKEPINRLLHAFRNRAENELVCFTQWKSIPEAIRGPWVRQLGRQRLFDKAKQFPNHSQGAFLSSIRSEVFAVLGYAKNEAPMRQLFASASELGCFSSASLAAELLGLSNLYPLISEDSEDEFVSSARDFGLRHARSQLHREQWHFFRLRPKNFPPLRIAQAAALLGPEGPLCPSRLNKTLNDICSARSVADAQRSLKIHPGKFWETHIRLDRVCQAHDPWLGQSRISKLLLNVLLPAALSQALQHKDESVVARIFMLFGKIRGEEDEVTRKFPSPFLNSLETQGLHQLYSMYCTRSRCLSCAVGSHICSNPEPQV